MLSKVDSMSLELGKGLHLVESDCVLGLSSAGRKHTVIGVPPD